MYPFADLGVIGGGVDAVEPPPRVVAAQFLELADLRGPEQGFALAAVVHGDRVLSGGLLHDGTGTGFQPPDDRLPDDALRGVLESETGPVDAFRDPIRLRHRVGDDDVRCLRVGFLAERFDIPLEINRYGHSPSSLSVSEIDDHAGAEVERPGPHIFRQSENEPGPCLTPGEAEIRKNNLVQVPGLAEVRGNHEFEVDHGPVGSGQLVTTGPGIRRIPADHGFVALVYPFPLQPAGRKLFFAVPVVPHRERGRESEVIHYGCSYRLRAVRDWVHMYPSGDRLRAIRDVETMVSI
ncbi:hypothetical protein [Nocardia terpenica]|uniref:hypothetical protein n=1 Tax=Nocardia terpenica TaxID=455432 RepID=UPI0012FD9E52|nr:hypothetical protein [Nocardia terpenica]